MRSFKASAAQVVITPSIGMPLAGTRIKRISKGIKDTLYAKVLIINKEKETIVIVTCDLLAISRESVNRIRKSVEGRLGIPGKNILISATHTHTGVAVVSIFEDIPDITYIQILEKKILEAIEHAYNKLETVTIKQGIGKEEDIIFNRRVLLKDGTVIMGGMEEETKIETIKEVEGPIDPDIGVLSFENNTGDSIAVLYNFSCHANIIAGLEISADFPYYVQQSVNRLLETDDIPVIFLTGACGNIHHLNVFDPDSVKSRSKYFDPRGLERCRRFSIILASEIVKAALKSKEIKKDNFNVSNKLLKVEIRTPNDDEVQWAKLILNSKIKDEKDEASANAILKLKKFKESDGYAELELQIINIGEVAIIAIPGEVFVEIGLKIKKISPFKNTFIATLANGYEGYMPTQKAFKNGGYETTSAIFSSQLSRNIEDILVTQFQKYFDSVKF